jgi:succinoglycan biosynthesis transport protein ExoP
VTAFCGERKGLIPVDLRDYVRILRKRWPIIVAAFVIAGASAAAIASRATPVYAAHIQLFVTTPSGGDNTTGLQQGNTFTQERVKSYAEIVSSPKVLDPVIAALHLPESDTDLAQHVSASAPLDTVLINVSVTDTNPALASRIANAVGTSFSSVVTLLEEPASGGASPIKVTTVKQATVPRVPVSPNKKLDIALGLLIGLAVGLGIAVLRDTLDTTVKTMSDLALVTKSAFLGGIVFDPEVPKRPLITHADPQSRRAESFRHLRTNLQFLDITNDSKSFVITSSVGGEGKSTTCANLAVALAATGSRVALVEGDLRRPKVADYLGLERAVGLTTVLIGQATVTDVMQSWGNGQLHVLPAGRVPPNPSELLGSQAMQSVIRQLEASYDYVLIDAPPLLPVTDATVLSRIAGGAIVVVGSGKIRREQLRRSLETLAAVDAPVHGVILNFLPTKGPDAYSYYAYGYDGTKQKDVARAGNWLPDVNSAGAPTILLANGRRTRKVARH